MPVVHYLNVKDGDCSVIQHASGHVSVIDVCNARKEINWALLLAALTISEKPSSLAKYSPLASALANLTILTPDTTNFNQKAYPVNPIKYLKNFIMSVCRFCRPTNKKITFFT